MDGFSYLKNPSSLNIHLIKKGDQSKQEANQKKNEGCLIRVCRTKTLRLLGYEIVNVLCILSSFLDKWFKAKVQSSSTAWLSKFVILIPSLVLELIGLFPSWIFCYIAWVKHVNGRMLILVLHSRRYLTNLKFHVIISWAIS